MEAKELKIGNILSDGIFLLEVTDISIENVKGDIHEVIHPKETEDYYACGTYSFSIGNIQGIPLTEEWLLKFGFTKEVYSGYFLENGRKSFLIAEGQDVTDYIVFFKSDVGMEWYEVGFSPKVHELQNLYFALIGEELTIKS